MESQKITDSRNGPSRRRYEDACGTAHALDLIGERWALLVMRELMLGPKRFSDIRADLPGISANVLTQRLEGLEDAGIVTRQRLEPPASGQVYALTEWGQQARPIMGAMGRWASRSPGARPRSAFQRRLADAVLPGDGPAGADEGGRRLHRLSAGPGELRRHGRSRHARSGPRRSGGLRPDLRGRSGDHRRRRLWRRAARRAGAAGRARDRGRPRARRALRHPVSVAAEGDEAWQHEGLSRGRPLRAKRA